MTDKIISLFTASELENGQRDSKELLINIISEGFDNQAGSFYYLRGLERNFQFRGTKAEKNAHMKGLQLETITRVMMSWKRSLNLSVQRQLMIRGRTLGIFDNIHDDDKLMMEEYTAEDRQILDNSDNSINPALLNYLGVVCHIDQFYRHIRKMKLGLKCLWKYIKDNSRLLLPPEFITACDHLVNYYALPSYEFNKMMPAVFQRTVEQKCNMKSKDFFKNSLSWPNITGYFMVDDFDDGCEYGDEDDDDFLASGKVWMKLYNAFITQQEALMSDQRVIPKPHSFVLAMEQMVAKCNLIQNTGCVESNGKMLLETKINYKATGEADKVRLFVVLLKRNLKRKMEMEEQ